MPWVGADRLIQILITNAVAAEALAAKARSYPIFQLTAADGAIGSHSSGVQEALNDFNRLAQVMLERMALPPPRAFLKMEMVDPLELLNRS